MLVLFLYLFKIFYTMYLGHLVLIQNILIMLFLYYHCHSVTVNKCVYSKPNTLEVRNGGEEAIHIQDHTER